VVAAIRHGWVAQNAAIAARQRQAAQEQAIVAWEQRADAALSALPAETQHALRRRATEVVARRFGQRLAATRIGAMLVTVEVRRLTAEQTGIPPPDTMSLPV
jgi:ABC-type transporter MlaC component